VLLVIVEAVPDSPRAGDESANATVEPTVSNGINVIVPTVDPVALDLIPAVTETESVVAFLRKLIDTVAAVELSDFTAVTVPVVAESVIFAAGIEACEGTELSTPRPNAATATSAMRLKFVVVDICFLSLVVNKYFSLAASR
jgi:hypothetical protein